MRLARRHCTSCQREFSPEIPRLQLCPECRAKRKKGTSKHLQRNLPPWRMLSRDEQAEADRRARMEASERELREKYQK